MNGVKNIFDATVAVSGAEEFATIFENPGVKIERIVSHSHSSPEGLWYDQSADEWVLVVRGAATLEFAGGELVEMNEGDHLLIPRHTRHRVRRTTDETIWLAVHLK